MVSAGRFGSISRPEGPQPNGTERGAPKQETGRSPHPLDDALLGHDVPAADADDLVDVLDERKVGSLDRALLDLCV